jgi:hypothetical protein
MSKKKILFVIGSPNQTTQMHQIADALPEYDCWFSQIYADSWWVNWAIGNGWVDTTILSGNFKRKADRYLTENGLQIDYKAKKNDYDLVVMCTDIFVPKLPRRVKSIWVQEGMIDKPSFMTYVSKFLGLPGYWAGNTSLNGSGNLCDVYCTASEGYSDFFANNGTDRQKLVVTGIPNYDNLKEARNNHFPYHDYVMVATTDMRETFRHEDRIGFIKECVQIADGRQLLFKLHPNELYERAVKEIREHAPADTLIFQEGDTNQMIANCQELVTQYSTVVYTGIALGKKVYSYFDIDELYRLCPIQNDGTSAMNIAQIARDFIEFGGAKEDFIKNYSYRALQPVMA